MCPIAISKEAAARGDLPKTLPACGTVAAPRLDTRILFAGSSEIAIVHGAETYRLRLTRQNRLILTK
jgi:hemin uptake protein HemP